MCEFVCVCVCVCVCVHVCMYVCVHMYMCVDVVSSRLQDVLGMEVAGVVVEVGDAVSQFQVGDRVMALLASGGYAEECVVDYRCVGVCRYLLNGEGVGRPCLLSCG